MSKYYDTLTARCLLGNLDTFLTKYGVKWLLEQQKHPSKHYYTSFTLSNDPQRNEQTA